MLPTLYCATSNLDKVREFKHALADFYVVEQVPRIGEIAAPEETGATFEANAVLKAIYYSKFTEEPVFADDSGLEVDAIGGEPGVYSARYSGPQATNEANNRLVVERMRGIEDRTARFVCVIALAQQCKLLGTFRGSVEGRLLDAPRGTEGFGYDPLFYYPPFGCSFGEASLERKSTVSHRGRALAAMIAYLQRASDSSR
jgi:XTP/dITP diphosphohydrolase